MREREAAGHVRAGLVAICAAAWAAFGALTLLVATHPDGTALDLWLAPRLVQSALALPMLAAAGRILDVLGGDVMAMLIVAIVGLLLVVRRHGRLAGFEVASALGGVLLCTTVKYLVDRPRPATVGLLLTESTPSYPSGHATAGITVFVGLGIVSLLVLTPGWRWAVATPLFVIGPVIGVSRSVVGVHWPTDVLGGWALGAAWMATVALIAIRAGGSTNRPVSRPTGEPAAAA